LGELFLIAKTARTQRGRKPISKRRSFGYLTNRYWLTLLFPRAAIVIDVGAPLSHAAFVVRELEIPAVVGCGNA